MDNPFAKPVKLVILASSMALAMIPVPASARFGDAFGAKSGDASREEPATTAEQGGASGPRLSKESATDADTVAPEDSVAGPAGATSFDTLCGNGQGKPDGTNAGPRRKGLFGKADRMAKMTRKIPLVGDFLVDSANDLSQAVACRLYPEEQQQAAEATQRATEGGEIGKKVEWRSSVRDNVSGSSTIASKNALPDGTPCMLLTDIVIVDGEELKVSKTMCKPAGTNRYTIMDS